jgi:hypothetical protein
MGLDFDDPDTEVLVRQLASRLGVSPAAAIKRAVRNELARLESTESEAPHPTARSTPHATTPGIDKNEFNELNEDG